MKDKFAEILGGDNVSDKENDIFVYKQDGSGIEGSPKLIVWPSTTEDVARIVKLANIRNIPLVARGAGTSNAGCIQAQNAIVLDLGKMDKIVRVNLTERSITVQPGVTAKQINNLLSKYDLHFPVIPQVSSGVSTIGGIISRNIFSCSPRFGRAGDWVMSLEVVDGTGKIFNPSKVPLFIGSEGLLGIITQLTLKLIKPIPVLSGSWKSGMYDELVNMIPSLLADNDVFSIDFFDSYCSQLLGLGEKSHLWAQYTFLDKGDLKESNEINSVKQKISKIYMLLKQNKYTLHTDPFVPKEHHLEFLRFCKKNEVPVYAHIASGIFHACARKEHPEMAYRIYKMAQKLNGFPSGENGIGRVWKDYAPENWKNQIREHKKFYDPSGILNPGSVL